MNSGLDIIIAEVTFNYHYCIMCSVCD